MQPAALIVNNEPCASVNHVSITRNLTLAVFGPKTKSEGKLSAVTYGEDLTSWWGAGTHGEANACIFYERAA